MRAQSAAWPLRVLALIIAMLLWVFVTLDYRGERAVEKIVEATVTYPPLEGFVILNPVDRVELRLRGRERAIAGVTPFTVGVRVEIEKPRGGVLDVPLSAQSVRVPSDVEVVSIQPNVLHLDVDSELTRLVPVRVRLTGEPAAGARALEAQPRPRELLMRGPASILRPIESVSVSVSLEGHALSFEEPSVVQSPNPLVSIVQSPVVEVWVPMEQPDLPPADDGGFGF